MVTLRTFTPLLLSAAFASPYLAAQTTSWAPTATQGVTSLVSATDLGHANVPGLLTIRLGLKLQNKAALDSYIQNINNPGSPLYGQSLSAAQFAAQYTPSAAQVQAVVTYLQSLGFTGIGVEPNNLLISAQGSVAQVEEAFHTNLEQYSQNGQLVFANTTPAMVPASLGGTVAAVLGLTDASKMTTPLQLKTNATIPSLPVAAPNYPASYTPQQYWQAYSATGVNSGANTPIAIFAEGDLTGVLKDLRTAEAAFHLPQVPVTVVHTGLASTDTSGADEWDLDSQYTTGMAQTVKALYFYDATSLTDSDLALAFSRFATDKKALVGNASFGECEAFPYIDGSMLVDDEIFAEAAAQGQTVFASSGDTGGFCPVGVGTNGVPAGAPFVQYPAASPYVNAVGGTTLLTNSNGSYNNEIAWYAGGGGISQFETSPYWQVAAKVPSAAAGERGVPDIAMVADPESGAVVYVNGAPLVVGGTSLSSPLAVGVWARILTRNPKAGFAPVRLYGLYDGATTPGTYPKGGFHDIILGENNPYPAAPGYDYTTGLGTLWVSQLSAALAH
jgi:pseudomonalisin